MERNRITRHFTNCAAGVLAAFAAALFLGNLATLSLTHPRDPLLGLPTDRVFWILGSAALAGAAVCVSTWRPGFKLVCVLWLALNGVLYRAGLYWLGVQDLRGYFSALAGTFNVPTGVAVALSSGLFLCLLAGGGALLLWGWVEGDELKAICARCGGHVAFSPRNLGQTVACPHCQASLTLRGPDSLKMTCYFCKGHIAFPPHALGTKLQCPHCRMDITLKAEEKA